MKILTIHEKHNKLIFDKSKLKYKIKQTKFVKNIPPKPTSPEELMAAYPKLEEKTIEADNEIREKVYQLREAQEQQKGIRKKEKDLKI